MLKRRALQSLHDSESESDSESGSELRTVGRLEDISDEDAEEEEEEEEEEATGPPWKCGACPTVRCGSRAWQ